MTTTPDIGGEWDGVVVLCAANNWDDVKLADRHLAERLTTYGPVLYVDPPMSHLTRLNHPHLARALKGPRLRGVAPRLARYTPVVPPRGLRSGMATLSRQLVRRGLARAVRELGGRVQAVIAAAPRWPMFGVCGEEHRIFWAQDDYAGGAALMGQSAQLVLRGELSSAEHADLLVASSPSVAESWRRRGYDPVLIPFGCDAHVFASSNSNPWPHDVDLPPPIAGFIGHLNDRTDLRLLEAVVDAGLSLLLVGPRNAGFEPHRIAALLRRPRVDWIGPKPFEELPPYLRAIDVGLVPYTASAFNVGSFPLKTLEYLSAGLPVVSTDLPSTRWLDTDLVAIDSTPEGFAGAALRGADLRRQPVEVRRRQAFAASHDWSCRAREWAKALDLEAVKDESAARLSGKLGA